MPLIDVPHANKSYTPKQPDAAHDSIKRRAAAAAALLGLCALAALASTGSISAAAASPLQSLTNKPPAEKTSIVDFAEAGVATGGEYALAAAHTGADFMLDSNFSLESTRDNYLDKGDGTKADFGELVEGFLGPELTAEAQHAVEVARAQAIEATKDAAEEPAVEPAPAEKTSMFDVAKQGVQTGGEFALLGGKTGLAFMTDSNFTMDKTADDFADQGSETKDAWGGIATGLLGPQLSSQAEAAAAAAKESITEGDGAAAATETPAADEPPAEKSGWKPFAQTGVETGENFGSLGAKTAEAFATDPDFDFGKTGGEFQAEGAATESAFGSLGHE